MARTLGGITLPEGIRWADRTGYAPVSQAVRRTLAGNPAIFAQALSKGRPITLIADEGFCWFTPAQQGPLQALADVAGGQFVLVWDSEQHTVMFRHNEPPALDLSPLVPFENPADEVYIGAVKLITV